MENLLGFQFYGAGNVGDDLMLGGFLDAVGNQQRRFRCVLPTENQLSASRKRFPEIDWTSTDGGNYGSWWGVGDTPIQASSGPWCLEQIKKSLARDNYKQALMVGIGAEREAIGLASEYRPLLRRFKLIGTRDEESADLLIREFGCSRDQVMIGGDLAHLCSALHSAKNGLTPLSERRYTVGSLICGGDGLPKSSLREVRIWLSKRDPERTALLTTEARPLPFAEVDLHRRWTANSFWRLGKALKIDLLAPDYRNATSLSALIKHFGEVQCLISSRYHGIVIGAWMGCRVAAVARGSKIEAIARELGIPMVNSKFGRRDLDRIYAEAQPVDRKRLDALALRAAEAVRQATALSD